MQFLHLRAAAVVAAVGSLAVLGTAAPGYAGAASSTSWAGSLAFSGSVSAALSASSSGVALRDYVGDTYFDRATALPAKTERVTVALPGGSVVCDTGPTFVSLVSIYGAVASWSHITPGTTIGANVEISCLTAGAQHKIYWGARKSSGGAWVSGATTNCVQLSRNASGDTFTLSAAGTASEPCLAQDTVVDSRMRFVQPAVEVSLPFSATLRVPGLTP